MPGSSRWDYYLQVMAPLQAPLLRMGARGMPVDEEAIERKRVECLAKVEAATKVLVAAGADMLVRRRLDLETEITALLLQRDMERGPGDGRAAFSKAKELTKLRTKLKAGSTFNPDSSVQRCALLYSWYALPPVKNKGAVGYTSDDTAVEDLMNRLKRGTIKPKRATVEEVLPVLQAMIDVKRWATLERTFLRPVLR